jgi:FkbM family methyltransferase
MHTPVLSYDRLLSRSRYPVARRVVRCLCWASGGPQLSARIPFGTLHGMRLAMPTDDHPALALGMYERHVVRALHRYTTPGAVAYDIGAHVGYMTLVLAKLVGACGQVFSFEPDPHNYAMLQDNVHRNHVTNVKPNRLLIADASEPVDFATFGYSFVNHIANAYTPDDAVIVRVEATTLDDFVYARGNPAPDVIKLDVEGAEEQVFRGACRLLREARPVIVAEIRAQYWAAISQQTEQCGYRAIILGDGDLLARAGIADVLFTPDR